MNFIKNHHESICFLKNQHFDPYFTLPLLLFASLPIEFYCGKEMEDFSKFQKFKFLCRYLNSAPKTKHFDVCIDYITTKYTESWFFFHLTKVAPELENQHSIQIQCMAHYSALLQIRANNSKLSNISESNIMILFWIN